MPSLVPEMKEAYKSLNGIQNGSDAMNAFPKLSQMNETEKEATRTALLEYCKLDTLAMVAVLKKLKMEMTFYTVPFFEHAYKLY